MSNQARATRVNDGAFAFCGIVSVLVGLVIVVGIIPDEYANPGALFPSSLALAIGMLVPPIVRAIVSGLRDAFRAEHFLLLALIYWILLDLLQTTYPLSEVDKNDVELAFIAVATMAIGIWIGVGLPRWRLPAALKRASAIEFGPNALYRAIWVSFLLGIFYYVLQSGFDVQTILNGLSTDRWDAAWSRGMLGGWSAFPEQLQYFGYVLPSLTVMLAERSRSRWFSPRVFVAILLSSVFLAFQLQEGGRRIIGTIIGAAILTWLLLKKRISFGKLAVVLVLVLGLFTLLQVILYARRFGFAYYFEYGVDASSKKDYYSVDDNFLRLAQIIHLFPNVIDYVGSSQIIFAIIRPIPRVLWPGKPIDPGFSLPELLGMTGVSLSSSVVGELYSSLGLVAVLLGGIFYGSIAKAWNALRDMRGNNNGVIMYALGVLVLFTGIRSMQDLVIMSYALLAWVVLSLMVRAKKTTISSVKTA